jgi:hypothetical protein
VDHRTNSTAIRLFIQQKNAILGYRTALSIKEEEQMSKDKGKDKGKEKKKKKKEKAKEVSA